MDDFVGKICGWILTLMIIVVVGESLLIYCASHADEVAELDPIRLEWKQRVKNLADEYLGLSKRFDEIKDKIDKINTKDLRKQDINIQNEAYNTFIESKNQQIEINLQIQDIDKRIFNLKTDILSDIYDNSDYKKIDYSNPKGKTFVFDAFEDAGKEEFTFTVEHGKNQAYFPEAEGTKKL